MDNTEPGPSEVKILTRKQIYDMIMSSELTSFDEKIGNMEIVLLEKYCHNEEQIKELKHKLSILKHDFKSRWQAAHKKKPIFEKNNSEWLNGTLTIQILQTSPLSKIGRPEKSFVELSERSKRRKSAELRSSSQVEELTYATQMKLRESGQIDASFVVKTLTKSPKRAQKYRKAFRKSGYSAEENGQVTPMEALYMYTEAGMTREDYEVVRSIRKKLYPCYSILQKAKNECLPPKESYTVTDIAAGVNLQDLLDLTVNRLILYLKEGLQSLTRHEKENMEIIYKWGCDGSQQVEYKQKFESEKESDSNIFLSSFVPLQIVCGKGKKTLWQNPVPSSPRYCRPIRIRFIHETVDVTNEEIEYINGKIANLSNTVISTENISVKHTLLFTMIDGKVCNAATHTTSTMRCYLCDATSKEFNDLSKRRPVKKETVQFGLSILHARIRFFESLLHLSYKLPLQKWQIRKEDKDFVNKRKAEKQNRFWKEMSLKVDIPRAGYGNSNDGNTSRRFFADHEKSAEITGIDVTLIYRFKVILETISSGHHINSEAFSKYAAETEELYVKLYKWHPMSPTIHKILRHGPEVIKNSLLPIGLLSEEAAEARNKHFREYRRNYARKFSRKDCNKDVLNRLLLTSDPVITGLRPPRRKKTRQFCKETIDMLLPSKLSSTEADNSESSSESEVED